MSDDSRRDFLRKAGIAACAAPFAHLVVNHEAKEPPTIIRPKALKRGDTIAITAPAGAVFSNDYVEEFTAQLKAYGFKLKLGGTITQRYGYLAGTDEYRAKELNAFFANESVDAIIAMRGGWGCARMLPLLDYKVIRNNPKPLIGFSDITALLFAIYTNTGLITFHGPTGYSTWEGFSWEQVQRTVMQTEPVTLKHPSFDHDWYTIHPGVAKGRLMGGNLSVLCGIVGSQYLPQWKNKILFLEETGEEVYRMDRMLTQLKLAGILGQISGFVFGKCSKCDPEHPERSLTLKQVFADHIKPYGIPAFYGAMIGHIKNKFTLPVGVEAEVDATAGRIALLESGVR